MLDAPPAPTFQITSRLSISKSATQQVTQSRETPPGRLIYNAALRKARMSALYPVPLTLEGSSVLHQMFRFDWKEWRKFAPAARRQVIADSTPALQLMEAANSAAYSMLGHKAGDLMLIHFRDGFDTLKQVELDLAATPLADFLEPVRSYVSVVELGLYESSVKLFRTFQERGIEPNSPEWNQEVEQTME